MKHAYILSIIGFGLLLGSGCIHKTVDEPTPNGNPGFNLVIEGLATPSTLYIPSTLIPQITTITAKVTAAGDMPVAGREVIFQQFEVDSLNNLLPGGGMGWGYFGSGYELSVKRQLDSNGVAQVSYRFPGAYTVAADSKIFIKVTLLQTDENREEVYDYIPVFLKVYDN